MADYRKRIADKLLSDQLESSGAVLIQGPKWCGKTTTAEQIAGSVTYMDDPEDKENNLLMAETNARRLLTGKTPRLIDEWQLAPRLWDVARFEIDHRDVKTGQFIFTGSSVPPEKADIHHSGTGRFSWLTMRPMSLWESGDSTGEVSLGSLFSGKLPDAGSRKFSIDNLAFLTCRGGWPASLTVGEKASLQSAYNYVEAVARSDISRVDGVQREPSFTKRLLRSYARHQGTQTPVSSIYGDLISNESSSLSENSVASYIQALKKIFVVEDMPAWNPNLRSKSAIRTSDTRYFVDPSIATAALGLGPEDLLKDLKTFGLLYETLAVRDLRVYADSIGGEVFHFRDRNGLECDAVVHLKNGAYGLIEIKLGGEHLIADGVKTLTALAGKIDTERMREPSFKMVLTGIGQYAYQREDGIQIVPIGCLKD